MNWEAELIGEDAEHISRGAASLISDESNLLLTNSCADPGPSASNDEPNSGEADMPKTNTPEKKDPRGKQTPEQNKRAKRGGEQTTSQPQG